MKYEYLKGSAKDFDGAPEWCTHVSKSSASGSLAWEVSGITKDGNKYQWVDSASGGDCVYSGANDIILEIIAERRPISDESDLNECIAPAVDRVSGFYAQELSERCLDTMIATKLAEESDVEDFVTFGKYDRQCKGVVIDVYDVLQAFEVVNPALQHLIKKALCAGLRGHKKREQDLVEILESAKRAIELEGK